MRTFGALLAASLALIPALDQSVSAASLCRKRFIVVAFLAMAVSAWARPTFVVTPDPIVNGYVYTFSGCGYVPNSSVYFFATEEGEHYQEFFYGTPTASDGCFVTPDAPWIWGAGGFDVQVMQKREENGRVRVLLRTSISAVE